MMSTRGAAVPGVAVADGDPRSRRVNAAMRKAAVLPVPVCDWPATSLSFRARGSAPSWIGVAVTKPASRIPCITSGGRSSAPNSIRDARPLERRSNRAYQLPESLGELQVFAVVDRNVDQAGSAAGKGRFESRDELVRGLDALAAGAERPRQAHESGVAERLASLAAVAGELLPSVHPVGVIAEAHDDDLQVKAPRRLQLLDVHQQSTVAGDGHHPPIGMEKGGRHGAGEADAH